MGGPVAASRAGSSRATIEWPTWLALAGCYLLWSLALWQHELLGWFWCVPGALSIAFHSSLMHEASHGHPTRKLWLNEALVFPSLGVFLPYRRFRETHLIHHNDDRLTDPYDDPETFYLAEPVWKGQRPLMRRFLAVNATFAGRMLIGPALAVYAFYRTEWTERHKPGRAGAWMRHVCGVTLVGLALWAAGMPVWWYLLGGDLSGLLANHDPELHRAPRGRGDRPSFGYCRRMPADPIAFPEQQLPRGTPCAPTPSLVRDPVGLGGGEGPSAREERRLSDAGLRLDRAPLAAPRKGTAGPSLLPARASRSVIAALQMYDWPEVQDRTDRFWDRVRLELIAAGIEAPLALSRPTEISATWTDPGLVVGQTCGLPYVSGRCGGAVVVGRPCYALEGAEGGTYRSALICRADEAGPLSTFRGRRAAVNEIGSQSGCNALAAAVQKAKLDRDGPFFGAVVLSGAHRASAMMVDSSEADIAAIDAVAWALLAEVEPARHARLSVIAWTRTMPALPFITAPAMRDKKNAIYGALLEAALAMDQTGLPRGHSASGGRGLRPGPRDAGQGCRTTAGSRHGGVGVTAEGNDLPGSGPACRSGRRARLQASFDAAPL